jgi:poly-gamma-glutamate capsule biosynthesis protein CapA/YwtB (metallophosphatase superfamily)
VDGVSTANNHALDQHRAGIVETIQHAGTAGLWTVGTGANLRSAWTPRIVERKGMRIGFLAFTRILNGFNNAKSSREPHVSWAPSWSKGTVGATPVRELLARVRAAAATCDALIVLPHWGEEYVDAPRPAERALAQQLLEAGALAVVGHHPHVLQPVEWVTVRGRRRLVAYSLGNLLANQAWDSSPDDPEATRRDSLLLELRLQRGGHGKVEISDARAVPVWIENARTGKNKAAHIQTVVLDEEIAALQERLSGVRRPETPDTAVAVKRLETRLESMKQRRERILRFFPEENAKRHSPASALAGSSTLLAP